MESKPMGLQKCITFLIRFKNDLKFSEIPFFRGAIIHLTSGHNTLYHNHEGDGFRYSYPLIQYKVIGGKAAILCIGEGTEAIEDFFSGNKDVAIGNRNVTLETDQLYANQTIVQVWNDMFTYKVKNWMPLNQENYIQYNKYDSLADKYRMLEKLLIGNILSFAKGVGITIEKEIKLSIVSPPELKVMTYKGVKMTVCNADFSTNVSLPAYIGLGKGASHGFGTVIKQK